MISVVRSWWERYRRVGLSGAVVLMGALAAYRLGYAFARLLWNYGDWANVDIRFFHRLVHGWFAGQPIPGSVYPPAARWLWAVTSIAAVGWLTHLVVRQSGATRPLERWFVGLLPLSMYATSATIGNGQLAVHLLPALLAGTLLLAGKRGRGTDLLAALLILFALIKPTISAPFFWIVIFSFGSLGPAATVVAGYVGLTLLAALLRNPEVAPEIVKNSVEKGVEGVAIGSAEIGGGFANLHDWLTALGLERWNLAGSLAILLVFGFWAFRHRRIDLWVLLGVAALVSRFWAYHRLHDDLVILIPMITLFRIAQGRSSVGGAAATGAGILLALAWLGSMAPAGLLFASPPLNLMFDAGQTVVWLCLLAFLIWVARRERSAGPAAAG